VPDRPDFCGDAHRSDSRDALSLPESTGVTIIMASRLYFAHMRTALLILTLSVLVSACGAPAPVHNDRENVVDPEHGKEVVFLYGAVEGVTGTNANGVAFLRVFEDGVSRATVNVNIAPPETGKRYSVNLSDSANLLVECGELRSVFGDVRHAVECDIEQDLREYTSINILLDSGDTRALVAHATVKVPKPAVTLE
jgi:hypothetical protein